MRKNQLLFLGLLLSQDFAHLHYFWDLFFCNRQLEKLGNVNYNYDKTINRLFVFPIVKGRDATA